MKKRYLTKTEMAKDLVKLKGITLADAKARLSRAPLPDVEPWTFMIEDEKVKVNFYLTPTKYLVL